MNKTTRRSVLYKGHRFPPLIISHCVWVYFRFCLSFRDVSELLLARGIEVSHEAASKNFTALCLALMRLWIPRLPSCASITRRS